MPPTELTPAQILAQWGRHVSAPLPVAVPYEIGNVTVNTDTNGDAVVSHGLGVTPTAVFLQNQMTGINGHSFAVWSWGATSFTVRCYYNNTPHTSATDQFFYRVEV